MPQHEVQQGECLRSIASRYGWSSWRALYEHADNEDLRARRPDPEVLAPGDVVVIPDGTPAPARAASPNRLTPMDLQGETTPFRMTLTDRRGRALDGRRYVLQVEGHTLDGVTSDEGLLLEQVPVEAQVGSLTVWLAEDRTWECAVKIGHLDPLDSVTGVQARLKALGYATGLVDGDAGEVTRAALAGFQAAEGLEGEGELTEETRARLREVFGC